MKPILNLAAIADFNPEVNSHLPIFYAIKVNARARKISLKINHKGYLELTIPHLRHQARALEFLRSQQEWIERQQAKGHLQVRDFAKTPELPTEVYLPALNQRWQIYYECASRPVWVMLEGQKLLIKGRLANFQLIQKLLLRWLKHLAYLELLPRLDQLSKNLELPYRSLQIKNQQMVWGSCSRTHQISLNIKLLFFPEVVMQYILIHELCHTRYFNHSPLFWQLVARYMPDYKFHKKILKSFRQFMPEWLIY